MYNLGDSIEKAVESVTGSMFEAASQVKSTRASQAASGSGATITASIDPTDAAISSIEDNEGLSDCDFVDACEVIVDNPRIGAMYLAISKPSARTLFLRRRLDKYRAQKTDFE